MNEQPSDKQIALHLIGRMDDRVSLGTIVRRLSIVDAAKELAEMLVADNVLDAKHAADWLMNYIDLIRTRK